MRKTIIVTGAVAALALGLATPAMAATTGGTTTTFTLGGTPGSVLSITVPTSADLGTYATGTTSLSGTLGPVTVTDARGLLTAAWTTVASSTSFTTGTATPAETIPNTDVGYRSGIATATAGIGVFTPGSPVTPVPMGSSQTAYSLALGVGNNSATWNPTISVAVPAAAVAGTYTGTITHSVS
jgi:hypothetical protein